MTVTLRPHQVVACQDIDRLFQYNKIVASILPTGAGKCHGVNTPILMFDGTIKKVQDVRVGDLLMGPDSKPREVLTLARGREDLFRVTPVKGDSYVVNKSHILSLKKTGTYEIVNVPLTEYVQSSSNFKHLHKGWRTGVEFEGDLDDKYLTPYLLGVWLGDGSSNGSSITSADPEIVEYIKKFCSESGQDLRIQHQVNNASSVYHITGQRRRSNTTLQDLKGNNLILNKHIPHKYKVSKREYRLELLAGILDSDGHLSNGYYDVIFKSKKLADDTVYVARSLGLAAYVKPCRKTCTNTGFTGDYYRISISGDVSLIPTKLARHQAEPRKQKKSVLVTSIDVEHIGEGDYYGFTITGDHLYLLGDFTVTHNTLVKAEYARRCHQAGQVCVLLAHRDVLLGQISDALCLMGVPHSFICADKTQRDITNANLANHGNSFYDMCSPVVVVSVMTMVARLKKGTIPQDWLYSVNMWLMDEAHHLTKGTSWGQCVEAMPNAFGLGVTATPIRGDKKGLGADNDGYFDAMSVTTNMWDLIKQGRLTPYKIFTPPISLDLSDVNKTSKGDYSNANRQLAKKVDKREVTGDAVEHYMRVLNGQPVITFCVDIEHSQHVADQFNRAGIPSKAVSSKTPIPERNQAIKDLREGRLLNLVNCDLFGEGFDAPSVAGVIMLRPTQSYSLYKQQFGRCLRPADGKSHGILLDHVGNTRFMMTEYMLAYPHDDPEWTLERRSKRKKSGDSEKLAESHTCPKCTNFWIVKDYGHTCPECGHDMTVKERETEHREIQVKEGQLVELSVDAITELLNERDQVDLTMEQFADKCQYMPSQAKYPALNNHAKRLGAQESLRHAMQDWCVRKGEETGWSVDTVQREFEMVFGVNIFKAQVLSARQANELETKVRNNGYW